MNYQFKKVMVIDDNHIDRYIAQMNIQVAAFAEEIVLKESARKGYEYLESLASRPDELPQIIFLDIKMPEIDGFGFLEMYNGLPEMIQKNCIIMMLTSSLSQED